MPTISLCMIVKNEEEVLEQCLNSVKEVCDEIIIVDTGSTDKTKEIASTFTNRIIDYKWIDDFSAARNYAFSNATMDFILWLDADDSIQKDDLEKLKALKNDLNSTIDAVSMIYHYGFDEKGNPNFIFRRNRLVKRSNQFRWHGPVHEYLEVRGNIIHSDIAVSHNRDMKQNIPSRRNITIYENRLKKGEVFAPRDLYYYANELKDHQKYRKGIRYYDKFLATKNAWVEDEIMACFSKAECYQALGEKDNEMNSLLQSLKYDWPRPEFCCKMGNSFMEKREFETAAKWYHAALENKKTDTGGFQNLDYSTWYPHLQLCICYWELGDLEKSCEHNEKAGEYRPDDPSVLSNRTLFK
ncbi:glycosyltransferase involved in cell wall biosynthesis [Neobacillus niacini]|uniref:glycosyltransferase family 2 protein n=1 Tax=Neobacillus niacini TaxID=86668 RepID=UPI002856E8FE|nr:glycosyltransferase family 2 protein [Neobacillus niacini]MDR7078526.1 glycosyltransferase involved in cell wall biosynthesis [Neobacillus niacini]